MSGEGEFLGKLLSKNKRALIEAFLQSFNTSKVASSDYKAFLQSKKGRKRLRKYLSLMIKVLKRHVKDFYQDQIEIGRLRALQGVPVDGVLEVALHFKKVIWNLFCKEFNNDFKAWKDGLNGFMVLEETLDITRAILARAYVETREEEIARRERYLRELYSFTSEATSIPALDSILKDVVMKMSSALNPSRCALGILNATEKDFTYSVFYPFKENFSRPLRIDCKAMKKRLINIPIKIREKVIGTLYIERALKDPSFSNAEKELIISFANTAGVVIENARLFEELLEKKQTLEGLIAKTVDLYEEERRRIASDIHDSPVQTIIGALYFLETAEHLAESEEVKEEIRKAQFHIREAIQEIRRVIVNLRPLVLDDLGFWTTLQAYLEDFSKETGIKTQVRILGHPRPLDSSVEILLFRVTQEALSNVKRHSGATNVSIRIKSDSDKIILTIQDNGHGFDLKNDLNRFVRERKFGLVGMKERIERIGGHLEINTKPGLGTKTKIILFSQFYR